jgi:hypothetical protein
MKSQLRRWLTRPEDIEVVEEEPQVKPLPKGKLRPPKPPKK